MWNLKSANKVCEQRRITEAQKKHMINLATAKCEIDINQPWKPIHNISKTVNKFTNQNNIKIFHENQILL